MAAKVRLADLCNGVVDCPHSTPVWTEQGVVVLRNQNIKNGRLDLSALSFTDEEHFRERTRRAVPAEGDLVITREAPMGEVCMIPRELKCCLGQRMVLLQPNRQRVEPRFLLYAIQSPDVQHEIRASEGTGSTVSNLRIPLLESLPIPTPPLTDQRIIAHILGTLDDKIELNRRMSATLEAMAQALFKSWFVDFDPVRAKLEGRDPGLPKDIAVLFSDRLVGSELGEIPEGWAVDAILGRAELLSGGTPKTDVADYWGGDIPWASAKDVSQCRDAFLITTERHITQRGLDESSTQMIPPLTTVVVARGATTGRLTMAGNAMAMNQTCYALRSLCGAPFYLYCSARVFIDRMVHAAHGSVFDTITTKTFQSTKVVLAPDLTQLAFDAQVKGIFMRLLAGLRESETLTKLRDGLLPKLVSGEIIAAS